MNQMQFPSDVGSVKSGGASREIWCATVTRWAALAMACFLLTACAATFVPPHMLDERRVAPNGPAVTTVALVFDYRFHMSRYNYAETLREYYGRIADQIRDRLSTHGVTVTQSVFLGKQLDPDFNSNDLHGQPGHVLRIGHDSLGQNKYGMILDLNWRVTLSQLSPTSSTYQPAFLSGFVYRTCMGQLPVRAVWQDCADKVAEHVVDRLKMNGIVR